MSLQESQKVRIRHVALSLLRTSVFGFQTFTKMPLMFCSKLCPNFFQIPSCCCTLEKMYRLFSLISTSYPKKTNNQRSERTNRCHKPNISSIHCIALSHQSIDTLEFQMLTLKALSRYCSAERKILALHSEILRSYLVIIFAVWFFCRQ